MKIVASSDWRDEIPFDVPLMLAAVVPGDPARCAACGADAPARSRDELWAVKHRHPKQHRGYVRFYCSAHVPVPARPAAESAPARSERRRPAPRAIVPARSAAVCPDCFVEVPATGVCGVCGLVVG